VRTALYIGNYQHCVTEAQKLSPSSEDVKEECDVLMYRAMVAQGKYAVVKGDITANSSSALQAVKNLASYLHAPHEREAVLAKVKAQQEDGISMTNPTVALMGATVFAAANLPEDALRCLHGVETVEALALATQLLLQMHRVDLAKKKVKDLQKLDEDATLTQLANAWLDLALGGDKLQDAFYTFQEMCEKFGPTPLLLNGQAAAHMQRGQYDEAEEALLRALDKDPNHAETLVNLVAVSTYLGKAPEVAQRYLNHMRDTHPRHPYVLDLAEKEQQFDSFCQQLGRV
jgi:coatomer protein complex subunit epsilon